MKMDESNTYASPVLHLMKGDSFGVSYIYIILVSIVAFSIKTKYRNVRDHHVQ
jgi:hypothetical protein